MARKTERLMELKTFVPPEMHALVVARADANDRSISGWIRLELAERLAGQ